MRVESSDGQALKKKKKEKVFADARFNFEDETSGKGSRWFSLSSFLPLCRCSIGEVYEFFSRFNFPATFFRGAFETRLYAASNGAAKHVAFNADTRQVQYFCSPRFVFWYFSRRWVRAIEKKREICSVLFFSFSCFPFFFNLTIGENWLFEAFGVVTSAYKRIVFQWRVFEKTSNLCYWFAFFNVFLVQDHAKKGIFPVPLGKTVSNTKFIKFLWKILN